MTTPGTLSAMLDTLPTLDARLVVALQHMLPATGRDLLVRLRVVPPDVDAAHEEWRRLVTGGRAELARIVATTGSPGAGRALAVCVVAWAATVAEIHRRIETEPVTAGFLLLDGDQPQRAYHELVRRVRGRAAADENSDDAGQRALAALTATLAKTEATIAGWESGTFNACPFGAVAAAPAGWERANQEALDADLAVVRPLAALPSGVLDRGARGGPRPYAVRDAERAERRRRATLGRTGGGMTWTCECGATRRWTVRACPVCKATRPSLRQQDVDPDQIETPEQTHEAEIERIDARARVAMILDAMKRSGDARKRRAAEALETGAPKIEAAKAAGVSRPTLDAWLSRLRETKGIK